MANRLTQIENLGIDAVHGIIPLIGEVNEEMYTRLIDCITALSNADVAYERLTILLNTYGGDLYNAFAIYDQLKSQEMKIRIVCNGPVMSAGTVILMAGDVREMTPLSFLMVHYGIDAQDSEKTYKHNGHLLKLLKGLYRENSNSSEKTINGWFNSDTYFTAEEALKLGLVDKITQYTKKPKRVCREKAIRK